VKRAGTACVTQRVLNSVEINRSAGEKLSPLPISAILLPMPPEVFLSYARADGEPLAADLPQRLATLLASPAWP